MQMATDTSELIISMPCAALRKNGVRSMLLNTEGAALALNVAMAGPPFAMLPSLSLAGAALIPNWKP
jgi:hypothetical protein